MSNHIAATASSPRLSPAWTRRRIAQFLILYTVLFFAVFALAYEPFLSAGKTFVWARDGRNQHYPALVYLAQLLRSIVTGIGGGQFALPMFDLNIGLGGDILSLLHSNGYTDPLNLLAVFVPTAHIETLYGALVVLRLYLAGLSFCGLCFYYRKPMLHTLTGCLIYLFSGYAVYSAMRHPHFINPLIQLPALLVGTDLVLRKRRPFLLIASVCYTMLCGYYFAFMMTIMTGVFLLVRWFHLRPHTAKIFFADMLRFSGYYLLGMGLAAVVFLPSAVQFLASGRAGSASVEANYFLEEWSWYHDRLLRIISPGGSWTILALAAMVLPAAALLFFRRNRAQRELRIFLVLSLVFYFVPLGSHLMNGFQYSSTRWTFSMALLLAYIVVDMLPRLLSMDRWEWALCLLTLAIYALPALCSESSRALKYYPLSVGLLALTLAVLAFCALPPAAKRQRLCAWLCLLLVAGNMALNARYRFAEGKGGFVKEFQVAGYETSRLSSLIEGQATPYLAEPDGRVDGSLFSVNMGLPLRLPTALSYWSVTNAAVTEFWEETENVMVAPSYHAASTSQRTALTTLLSQKYQIEPADRGDYVSYGYAPAASLPDGSVLYENQYALPWGYTYENAISYEELTRHSGLEQQEIMLQSIALEQLPEGIPAGQPVISSTQIPMELLSTEHLIWENGILTVEQPYATMTLGYDMPAGVESYVLLRGFDINNTGISDFYFTVSGHGVSYTARASSTLFSWYSGREDYLFNLGYSEGAQSTCTITFPKAGTFRLEAIDVLAQPMTDYAAQTNALRAEPLENIQLDTNRISGTITLSENKILCMSIPYSSGWSAAVDGVSAPVLRGNHMFMALSLPAGQHTVEFSYRTPGLAAGAAVSVLSLAAVCILLRRSRKADAAALCEEEPSLS